MPKISSHSVLHVDDDAAIRTILSMRLEEAGLEARQAEDGIDGLVKLRDKLPNVIISDLLMPRMSGIEFISVVHRRFPAIPVIVLTGSSVVELPPEARPDGWFEKRGLRVSELLQAVRDLAKKKPDCALLPQMISTPIRTHPNGSGYIILTCTDCFRLFEVPSAPENKTVERNAVCICCAALVAYLVESSEPV
jgi:CheY-like chemotaxis protein